MGAEQRGTASQQRGRPFEKGRSGNPAGRPRRGPLVLPDRVTLTQAGEAYVALFGGMLIALAVKAKANEGLLPAEYMRDAEVAATHYREFEGMRGRLVIEAMKLDPSLCSQGTKDALLATFQGRAVTPIHQPPALPAEPKETR